jgi:hypothetical protein
VKYNSGPSGSITYNQIIKADPVGNSYISGSYIDGNQFKGFSFKYNTSGTAGTTYWTANQMQSTCFWIDNNYNAYSGGYFNQSPIRYLDVYKCSPQGIIWEVKDSLYGYGGNEALDIISDNEGNTYLLRYKGVFFIYKYSNNGTCIQHQLTDLTEAYKIAYDENERTIIASGCTFNPNKTEEIIKYDTSITKIWQAEYGIMGDIIKTVCGPSGNIFVLDNTYGVTSFSPLGIQRWFYEYPGIPADMIIDNFENVIVTGSVSTKKLNQRNGAPMWTDNHPGSKLCADRNNGIYCLKNNNENITVSKFAPNGTLFWNYEYNSPGNGNDTGYAVSVDSLYNVYAAGQVQNAAENNSGVVFKLNQSYCTVSGAVTSNNGSSNVTSGYVRAVQYNSSSNEIYTADSTEIKPNGTYTLTHCPVIGVYIMALKPFEIVPTYHDTTIYWQNAGLINPQINTPNVNIDVKKIEGPKGTAVLTGGVGAPGIGFLKEALVFAKLGTQYKGYCITDLNIYGNIHIDSLIAGNYQIIANRIGYDTKVKNVTISNTGGVVIFSMGTIVPVSNENNKIPKNFNLHQNYPNPFNPLTAISFDLPEESDIKLKVYDITGKMVEELVDEVLKAGSYKVSWNASNYSSGVYFYVLSSDKYYESKKMVLVK